MSPLRWIYITLKFSSSSCVQKSIISNAAVTLGHSEEQAHYVCVRNTEVDSLEKVLPTQMLPSCKGYAEPDEKKSQLWLTQISRENPTCGSLLFLSSIVFFISVLTMRTNNVFLTSLTQWHSFSFYFVSEYFIFHPKCACAVQNALYGDVEESGFMSWG